MFSIDQIKPVLILVFAYFIYTAFVENKIVDSFVAFNEFESILPNQKVTDWNTIYSKFGTLVSKINNTEYSMSYQLDDILDTLTKILNSTGLGNFVIVSVGETKPFTLYNVTIQDTATLDITTFSRIDFITDSINPFKIQKIIVSPKSLDTSTLQSQDSLQPGFFQIQNPLHLFYPYKTSDDNMMITPAPTTTTTTTATTSIATHTTTATPLNTTHSRHIVKSQ